MNTSLQTNSESVESTDGDESSSELRDSHSALGVEEIVNEEEARRRREQLNRRPSYRMILKDLETVGDKPMKKEMHDDGNNNTANTFNHDRNDRNTGTTLHQLGSPSENQAFASSSNNNSSSNIGVGGLKPANLPSGLRVGVVGTAAASNQPHTQHISPPTQQNLAALGQLNLIGNPAASIAHQQQQNRLMATVAEMPSQPQPQQLLAATNSAPPPQPLLAAVNNLEMLGLKAPDALGTAAFGPNDWQNNLLSSYGRAQQQQPPQVSLMQQQQQQQQNNAAGAVVGTMANSPLGMNNIGVVAGHAAALQQHHQQQHVTPPPHGLGSRQGSASLTSFSPNVRSEGGDDNTRKRQVRLLKNREAAKECRRKKKEYVKCLENRVAVLENQNKALIEELKTLKELYCRKEKGDLQ
ncbi:hypothetical protein niasHS_002877 [Heterodera schachtii]|uniref:BZIP domain-containing protein n=1 Tax=Heterodera schachtii TaxID=97005 RepID=A0ABD2K948_HETSC